MHHRSLGAQRVVLRCRHAHADSQHAYRGRVALGTSTLRFARSNIVAHGNASGCDTSVLGSAPLAQDERSESLGASEASEPPRRASRLSEAKTWLASNLLLIDDHCSRAASGTDA